jgi:hypothetical protein
MRSAKRGGSARACGVNVIGAYLLAMFICIRVQVRKMENDRKTNMNF